MGVPTFVGMTIVIGDNEIPTFAITKLLHGLMEVPTFVGMTIVIGDNEIPAFAGIFQ